MAIPMNAYSQEFAPPHRLDSPKFGTFLFYPDSASVSIHFHALEGSPHDVVIQFPPTALCAGEIFTFTRSSGNSDIGTTFNTGTFEIQTAREIWKFLYNTGWSVYTARRSCRLRR